MTEKTTEERLDSLERRVRELEEQLAAEREERDELDESMRRAHGVVTRP